MANRALAVHLRKTKDKLLAEFGPEYKAAEQVHEIIGIEHCISVNHTNQP